MEGTSRLCIKILHLEYYMCKPLAAIDLSFSSFRCACASKLPIIRVYGTTPSGQKVCANVHGYMPYLYVTLPSKSAEYTNEDFLRAFCISLEKYLRPKTKLFSVDEIIVYHASFVMGRSIYGFTDEDSVFIKLCLLDPSLVSVCADILSSGSVLEQHFQPLETHLPYLLKFCIDHDLYGMNFLQVEHFMVRSDREVYLDAFVSSAPVEHTCPTDLLPRERLLPSHLAPRYTSTGLEVDIVACDILNKDKSEDHSDSNPGLDALWSEERSRRIDKSSMGCSLPTIPTPDELLPLSRDYISSATEEELHLWDQWNELCRQSVAKSQTDSLSMDSEDIVTQWLKQSQEEDEAGSVSISLDHGIMPFSPLSISDSTKPHSLASTQPVLSANALQELHKLATISEDADASVPASIDWGYLRNVSEWKSLEVIPSSTWKHSSSREFESHKRPPTGSSMVSLGPAPQTDSAQSIMSCLADDEAAILTNATQSAIQHVLSQTAHVDEESTELSVDVLDEHTLMELTDACVEPMADEAENEWATSPPFMTELWDSIDPDDEVITDECEEPGPRAPSQPSFQQAFSSPGLKPIDEGDELTHSYEDLPPGLFSPWSSLSDVSQPAASRQLSQPLVDSDSIEEYTDLGTPSHLPQLDGTNDGRSNDESSSDTRAVTRVRRRRYLGLRRNTSRCSSENNTSHLETSNSRCQEVSLCTDTQFHNSRDHILDVMLEPTDPRTCIPVEVEEPDQKLLQSPVVLLRRICDGLPQPASPTLSMDFHSSQRRSPRDEFVDKSGSASSVDEAPSDLSGVYSFYEESTISSDDILSSDESLGNLTLFSQSQYIPSPPPTPPPELLPIQIPVRCESLHSLRPIRIPPSLSSVRSSLERGKDTINPADSPNGINKLSPLSPSSLACDSQLEPNSETMQNSPRNHNLSLDFSSSSSESPVPQGNTSSILGNSSVASVSVLYQAASQRCFLPVQTDHTTVLSLEIHCRSRLISIPPRSTSINQQTSVPNQPPSSTPTANVSPNYGLLPDPSLDTVSLACLSFRSPIFHASHHRSRFRIDTFVLVNMSEIPSAHDCSLSPIRLGLTSAYSRSARTANHRRRNARRKWHPVHFICCRNEWRLFNRLIYFVQKFDPDILLGYDVERHSWGYLVDRAQRIGRPSFVREISRLAPDVVSCDHCRRLIDQCGTYTDQSSVWHLDECFSPDANPESCTCPCRCQSSDPADSPKVVSPTSRRSFGWPSGPGAAYTGGPFPCPGRVVLCLWRVVMSEVSLFEYSLETVVLHLLKEPVPKFSYGQLHQWFTSSTGINRWRTVDYWIFRSHVNLRIVQTLDLIGRTSEFARVFGIEFFHVLSRGSQYRVESMLGRIARRANFLLPSPNVIQRARQRAPEGIPLNLEPDSQFYTDGPVAVLDFQSLYPSIVIAYNYCFSTALGRLNSLVTSAGHPFDFGCLTHSVPIHLLQRLGSNVNISPNGVVFVKACVHEGILPRMLKKLLTTRLMVKESMKLYKNDRSLTRLLDARQLALKLMANVIFGYTAASFSGRMPCVEVGDSIVHKARETLERAIDMVETGQIVLPDSCAGLTKPRVVYGDTDSLFIHLPGCGKSEAFDAATAIAEVITSCNPAPIKLKVEKIYYPCLLEAKKRYVGYAYESVSQTEPIFDAKGIETVRRDSCPFVGKVLKENLRLLFDQFTLPELIDPQKETPYAHIDRCLRLAEIKVRQSIRQFAHNLAHGRVAFADSILARPYRGMSSYRSSSFAPALQVARRLLTLDPRAEPLVGERVVYFIAPGRLDQTLVSRVRTLPELYPPVASSSSDHMTRRTLPPRLHLGYYLDKQLIPPLVRMAQLIGWNVPSWLNDLPRYRNSVHQYKVVPPSSTGSQPPFPLSLNHLGSFVSSSPMSSQSPFVSRRGTHQAHNNRRRQSALLRTYFGQPVRICHSCGAVVPPAATGDLYGHCQSCVQHHSNLSSIGAIRLGTQTDAGIRFICVPPGHAGRSVTDKAAVYEMWYLIINALELLSSRHTGLHLDAYRLSRQLLHFTSIEQHTRLPTQAD